MISRDHVTGGRSSLCDQHVCIPGGGTHPVAGAEGCGAGVSGGGTDRDGCGADDVAGGGGGE